MATLLEKAQYVEDADQHATLLKMLRQALVEAAVAVRAEAEPEPITEEYTARQAWAINALGMPDVWTGRFLPGILTNATIATALFDTQTLPTDNDLQFAVNSLVTSYSDYNPSS